MMIKVEEDRSSPTAETKTCLHDLRLHTGTRWRPSLSQGLLVPPSPRAWSPSLIHVHMLGTPGHRVSLCTIINFPSQLVIKPAHHHDHMASGHRKLATVRAIGTGLEMDRSLAACQHIIQSLLSKIILGILNVIWV